MTKRIPFLTAALLCCLFAATASFAQQRQGRPQPPRSYTPELTAVVEKLAKDYQVRIVVDPAIFLPAPPAEIGQVRAVDEAIVRLTEGVKGVAWRKVYLTKSEAGSGIPAARLAAMVRAVDILETGGLVLENPGTRRATSLQKNLPVLPGFAEELRSLNFEPTPVYVIYSTAGGGSGSNIQDKFLDLQRQQMELMMQMDPDTLASAMAQGMQMLMGLDPQTRSRLIGNMMQAGMQMFMQMDPGVRMEMVGGLVRSSMEMWANMPQDQRQRFMQEMMQMGQQLGQQLGGPGGTPPGRP